MVRLLVGPHSLDFSLRLVAVYGLKTREGEGTQWQDGSSQELLASKTHQSAESSGSYSTARERSIDVASC
jgi:hypothetical protein